MAGHIMNGSNDAFKGSQFISTTRKLEIAEDWATRSGTRKIVAIDTSQVIGTVIDLSTPELASDAGLAGRVYSRAVASAEVLIEGFIPPEAIRFVE